MRSHRRRGPLEHILVAGSLPDLPAIKALLVLLPETVYGQVILETPADAPAVELAAPPRLTVTQLVCTGEIAAGELLAGATQSWLAEWMPNDLDPDRTVTLWVGSSARGRVQPTGAKLESL